MRASRTYGSMRGAPSNGRPYRNRGDTLRSRAPRPSPRALAYRLGGDSGSPSGALPFVGARRRRPLPRPALAVALRSMMTETEAKFASVGPTAEEDIGPALAPHLAKPDRDVDPGSGAGGHGSAVGERPEPSTRINKRRISSGRKRDRGARTWPRPCRRCCTR
jgi:hypothetical protein